TSNLPDLVIDSGSLPTLLSPLHLPQLIDVLEKSPEIKNIFYITEGGTGTYEILYFRNEPEAFKELRELGIKNYTNHELINWNPQSFSVFIPPTK
ncbi:MAG: hypothetical protein ACOC2U_03415, partial [bacterium]